MVHNLWCTSQDCLNLSRLLLHLRTRINLAKDVANRIASFLKLPRLNILARTETFDKIRYAFWDTSCPPFEFSRDHVEVGQESHENLFCPLGSAVIACDFSFQALAFATERLLGMDQEEGQLITCDFRFQVLAFTWKSGPHFTVTLVSKHRQQDITDVIEPSAAFSRDGTTFAAPVFVSGNACIAVYDVLDNAAFLLRNRTEILWPDRAGMRPPTAPIIMSFSPTAETLALAADETFFFIDLNGESFTGCTPSYNGFDIWVLQYSPDGCFVATAGIDLDCDYHIKFNGFIYMFDSLGNNLWKLTADSTGERLPGIDTLSFSSCNTKIACINRGDPDAPLYIVNVDSGHAHRLTVSAKAVVFDPSGQRLITVHSSSICILDIMSGAKLHEAPFFDSSLTIETISWPGHNREDD